MDLDGEPAYDLPEAAYDGPVPPRASACCRTSTRSWWAAGRGTVLFPGRAAERALVPSGQAGNYPVLLVDGEVAGVWHQKRSGRRIAVTVEPLRRLSKTQPADLEAQVARLGRILEGDADKVELTIGEVSVGPHA